MFYKPDAVPVAQAPASLNG